MSIPFLENKTKQNKTKRNYNGSYIEEIDEIF